MLGGILWVLLSGARWKDLPASKYPSYQTCHRWFQNRVRARVLRAIVEALAAEPVARGEADLRECFIDGSFAPAKKEGRASARPSAAKARKSWRPPRPAACRLP